MPRLPATPGAPHQCEDAWSSLFQLASDPFPSLGAGAGACGMAGEGGRDGRRHERDHSSVTHMQVGTQTLTPAHAHSPTLGIGKGKESWQGKVPAGLTAPENFILPGKSQTVPKYTDPR